MRPEARRRALWFLALYLGGALGIAAVAYGLRAIIGIF
jgi:hypothetical protein